jgi:hypothetical protein
MSSSQSIAERAYQLWQARGRPHGSEEEDWLEAERQLAIAEEPSRADLRNEGSIDSSLKESFPASDPPASHIPDSPPSNASDKWIAARGRSRTESQPSSSNSMASDSERANNTLSGRASHLPVDETDEAPTAAPGGIASPRQE